MCVNSEIASGFGFHFENTFPHLVADTIHAMSLKALFETDGIPFDFGELTVRAHFIEDLHCYRAATKNGTLFFGFLCFKLEHRTFFVLSILPIGRIRSLIPVATRAVCLKAAKRTFHADVTNHFLVHNKYLLKYQKQ
jgi:hypothetical protein